MRLCFLLAMLAFLPTALGQGTRIKDLPLVTTIGTNARVAVDDTIGMRGATTYLLGQALGPYVNPTNQSGVTITNGFLSGRFQLYGSGLEIDGNETNDISGNIRSVLFDDLSSFELTNVTESYIDSNNSTTIRSGGDLTLWGVSNVYFLTPGALAFSAPSNAVLTVKDPLTGKVDFTPIETLIASTLTASKATYLNSQKQLTTSAADGSKLDYLANVTGDLQSQLDTRTSLAFSTVDSMRAMSSTLRTISSARFVTAGRAAAGDGGGAGFVWSSSSTASTNLGTVFTPTGWNGTDAGRFVWDGSRASVDVRMFGAIPDQLTQVAVDAATDSTAAIQNAIDSLSAAGGGTVEFPAGSYMLSYGLQLKPRVNLRGVGGVNYNDDSGGTNLLTGRSRLFCKSSSAAFTMLTVSGSTFSAQPKWLDAVTMHGSIVTAYVGGVSIEGLVFDGRAQNGATWGASGGKLVVVDKVASVTIRGCGFISTLTGALDAFAAGLLTFDRNVLMGQGGFGVFLDECSDVMFTGNIGGGTAGPVLWARGNKNKFANNDLFNSGQSGTNWSRTTPAINTTTDEITWSTHRFQNGDPVSFEKFGATLPTGISEGVPYYVVVVDSNTIKLSTQRDSGSTGGARQGVANVDFTDSGSGAWVIGNGPAANVAVSGTDGNVFVGNRFDQGYYYGLIIDSSTGTEVVGNAITENGWNNSAFAAYGSQILLRNTATNNAVTANRLDQRSPSTAKAAIGLSTDSSSLQNFVTGNPSDCSVPVAMNGSGAASRYTSTWNGAAWYRPALMLESVSYGLAFNSLNQATFTQPSGNISLFAQSVDASPVQFTTYGTQGARVVGLRARGTVASPTQVLSGDELSGIYASGYHSGSAFGGTVGEIVVRAAENFTSTAEGTAIALRTTPTGSTTRRDVLVANADGTIGLPLGTASRALVTTSGSAIGYSTTTSTEIGYVSGVTSAIQTQLNAKAASSSPTLSGTVTVSGVTASRALTTDGSSAIAASATTATELGYVSGVTSSIQTQLNSKAPTASPTFTGTATVNNSTSGNMAFSVTSLNASPMQATTVGSQGARFVGMRGRGALGAVTQILNGDEITGIYASGYHSGGAYGGAVGEIVVRAAEDFTSTAQGTSIALRTTPTGSTSRRDVLTANADGTVGLPLGTASRALVTTAGNAIGFSATTATELGYLSGVTSSVQTQLNAAATTANLNPSLATLVDGATVTWTVSSSYPKQLARVTLGGNRTLAFSGLSAGMTGFLWVKQDATGSRTLTLPAGSKVVSGGAGAITLTTTANAEDRLDWVYDGTNLYWTPNKNFN